MEPIKSSICTDKLKSGQRFIAISCNETGQVEILTHLQYLSLYKQKFQFQLTGFPKFASLQQPQYTKMSQSQNLNHILGVVGVNGQFVLITGIQNRAFRQITWFTDVYAGQNAIEFAGAALISGFQINIFLVIFTQASSLRREICNRGSQLQTIPFQMCSECSGTVSNQIFQNCSQTCPNENNPLTKAQCLPMYCTGLSIPGCVQCAAYRQSFGAQFFSTTSTYSNTCTISNCNTVTNSNECPSAAVQAYTVASGNPICIPFSGTNCGQCTANSNCKFYDNQLCSSLDTLTNFDFATPTAQSCNPYNCPDASLDNFISLIGTLPLKQNCKWTFTINEAKVLKISWTGDQLSWMKINLLDKGGAVNQVFVFSLQSAQQQISLVKENSVSIEISKFSSTIVVSGEARSQSTNQKLSKEAIIGIAVGCSLFVIILVVSGVLIAIKCRKKKRAQRLTVKKIKVQTQREFKGEDSQPQ